MQIFQYKIVLKIWNPKHFWFQACWIRDDQPLLSFWILRLREVTCPRVHTWPNTCDITVKLVPLNSIILQPLLVTGAWCRSQASWGSRTEPDAIAQWWCAAQKRPDPTRQPWFKCPAWLSQNMQHVYKCPTSDGLEDWRKRMAVWPYGMCSSLSLSSPLPLVLTYPCIHSIMNKEKTG